MMIEHMEVTPKPTLDTIKSHKDYQQVVLDVNRSLKRFPPGIDDDYRLVLMDQLTTLIIRILMKHPELNYYQVRYIYPHLFTPVLGFLEIIRFIFVNIFVALILFAVRIVDIIVVLFFVVVVDIDYTNSGNMDEIVSY